MMVTLIVWLFISWGTLLGMWESPLPLDWIETPFVGFILLADIAITVGWGLISLKMRVDDGHWWWESHKRKG